MNRNSESISAPTHAELHADVLKLQQEVKQALAEREKAHRELDGMLMERRHMLHRIEGAINAKLGDHGIQHLPENGENKDDVSQDVAILHGCFLSATQFLGQANSLLRNQFHHVTEDQRKLIMETSHFSKTDKAEVDWVFQSTSSRQDDEMLGGAFQGNCDVKRLSTLFTELGEAKKKNYASVVEDLTDAFESNRSAVLEYMSQNKFASEDARTVEAVTNYGFSRHEEPYEYDEADRPNNIQFENKQIKGATLNKLVEMVTHEKSVDLNTRYVFLLTYHSFTTASVLLDKLAKRFKVPIPDNMTREEMELFKQTRVNRLQIRVCSVLKYWVDEHWSDFEKDEKIREQLNHVLIDFKENSGSKMTLALVQGLRALVKKREKGHGQKVLISTETKFPKPLINGKITTLDQFSLEEANETEIARQLSLIDFELFNNIQPRECLNQSWNKKNKAVLAPNILALIAQFNKLSGWVQFTIVDEPELPKRGKLYSKFIKIAQQCRELNNFNALFAIYCGLTANPIHRLRQTKELVPEKLQKLMSDFKELFRVDKNSRNFRRALKRALTPCIPHLGLFLTDLTFTEDGNPDMLGEMINFDKRCKLAERIRWIKQYQQEGYTYQTVDVIRAYLEKNLKTYDPEDLWQKSKKTEPRLPSN